MKHCIDCKHFQLAADRFKNGSRELQTYLGECTQSPIEDVIDGRKKIGEARDSRLREDRCGIGARWFVSGGEQGPQA